MNTIIMEFPNRDILDISIYDYTKHNCYDKYMDVVNNHNIAKELCKVNDVINDDAYWRYNNRIIRSNIFGGYYSYSRNALRSYHDVLYTMNDQMHK